MVSDIGLVGDATGANVGEFAGMFAVVIFLVNIWQFPPNNPEQYTIRLLTRSAIHIFPVVSTATPVGSFK